MQEYPVGGGESFPAFVMAWNTAMNLGTPAHHHRMAGWLEQRWSSPVQRNALLMSFRNSGKSTLVGLFCAWVLYRVPETRILVVAAEHGLARKMARNVKRIIERHVMTPGLLPPSRDQWAADEFTVARQAEWRDPSMLARGIGANITGARADLVVCDDVEVPNTCASVVRRSDLRARLRELDYVIVPGGMQLYIGTPHAADSVYAATASPDDPDAGPFLDGFERLEIPLVDADGVPAWPERFPSAAIEALRQRTGPRKFASQMQLLPVNSEDGRLDPDLLRVYDGDLRLIQGNGESLLTIGGVRMVSVACCWDPAFGAGSDGRRDGSVVAALFCDGDGTYWLHRICWLPAAPAGSRDDVATWQCRHVAAFVRDLHLPAIRVEINGLGRFLPSLLRKVLADDNLPVAVLEYTSHRSKAERILEALDAPLAAGRLKAHRSVLQTPFITELRDWRPDGRGHDDGLDAVAACLLAEPVRLRRHGLSGLSDPSPVWQRGGAAWTACTDFSV
ncbi:phage terminase large subunit [Haematospirillum sp. 15-248]|uniref:phage terminase large subunit n=1 Tax=Haematospirillum sp. 15-248 TaxID=2723107 RepID=UPI00143B4804|nr:phage terminase large subunit [Haematospirillum sp. 15-248]NKD87379.1 phage terminase large subunit [Haematospirillum sp. 15-248]